MLLRYDTRDAVRALAGPLELQPQGVPATGPIEGKLDLAVRHPDGWTTPRDVLEALEGLDAVPLPARCGFRGVAGGVAVEVVTRRDTPATRAGGRGGARGAGRPSSRAPAGGPRKPASARAATALRPSGGRVHSALGRSPRAVRRWAAAIGDGQRADAVTAGLWIVFAFAAGAIVLASVYFRRVRMPRPPLGVFNRADVLIMLATIALMPYLYLALPLWLDGVLLGALTAGILTSRWRPCRPPRWRLVWHPGPRCGRPGELVAIRTDRDDVRPRQQRRADNCRRGRLECVGAERHEGP